MNTYDEIIKMIKRLEMRIDKMEAYLSDFEPFDSTDDPDVMYREAEALVRQHEVASASLLQRRLAVGYARAARILDQLTERGVLESSNGNIPRKVIKK